MKKIFKLFAVVALALSSVGCIASGGYDGYSVVPYGGVQIQPRDYGQGYYGGRRLYNTRPGYVAPYQGWAQPYYQPPVVIPPPVYNFGGRSWGRHHRHHRDRD